MSSRFKDWKLEINESGDTKAVMRQINKFGFAIVQNNWNYAESDFVDLAETYRLGSVFQPQFNLKEHSEGIKGKRINQVGGLKEGGHYAFNGQSSIDLHTDGSYLPIGTVKTSILICKEPALTGGETILFDSVSAFKKLRLEYPDLADLLTQKNIFRRRSTETKSGKQYEYIGPIFQINDDDEIQSCFTLDVTADWDYSIRIDPRIERAIDYLKELAVSGSDYSLEFLLNKSHAIMIRNDLISHGRLEFTESDSNPRILFRGLFKNPPTIE